MGPFKGLISLFFYIQNSWQLSLLELPSLLHSCFFWRFHTHQHFDFLLGLLQLVYLHCSTRPIWPPLLMQHSCSTHAFKPVIPLTPTLYFLPLYSLHRLIFLDVFLYLLLPLPPDFLGVFSMECWKSPSQER